jgi:aldehyde:ferredoxin oxidoreductase
MGPQHKVLSIGPAGENLVPFACLSTDQYHKAGRGGAGAVMGAKNVKAVVVRGTGAVDVGDARAFARDILVLQNERVLTADNMWTYEIGTPMMLDIVGEAGGLPTRNWQTGSFEGAEAINGEALLRRRTKVRACTQCPLACRQVHAFGDYVCEGPEYETLGICGANCGIGDLDALAAFNRECDELGIDTISSGAVVALAMGLREVGVADYGLEFGDPEGYVAAPRLIATRTGIGADLALGAKGLAALHGESGLAAEVKNLDMPAYDPRAFFGMGLAYATSDRGACHMRAFAAGEELFGDRPPDSLEGKAQHVIELQDFGALAWTGIWCANMALDVSFVAAHFRHLWGREAGEDELRALGARVWNLGRLLNLREGLDASDDSLPDRLLKVPHPTGSAAGRIIGREAFGASLGEYFGLRGWDARGVPTEERLRTLGVDVRI